MLSGVFVVVVVFVVRVDFFVNFGSTYVMVTVSHQDAISFGYMFLCPCMCFGFCVWFL